MSVLLVNPPFLHDVQRYGLAGRYSYLGLVRKHAGGNRAFTLPAEHLGLMSVKAAARREGVAVTVVNGLVAEHRDVAQTIAAIEERMRGQAPPVLVGFSGPNLCLEENLALAAACRRLWPDARLVLGHDFATLNYERLLRDYPLFDFACRGEGEGCAPALAKRLLEGRDWRDVPGLAWREGDGSVRANAPTSLDLDGLPWPDRDELPAVLAGGLSAAVYASRGCPYRCTFCTTGEVAGLQGAAGYRLRDVEGVVEEMAYLKRDFGVGFVTITDDLFLTRGPASQARAERFARLLIERRLELGFMLDVRVDSLEPGLMRLLRRAGLRRVFVGVETGSDEQRAAYNKRYVRRGEDPAARLRALRDLGIDIIPGIITYHPHVTPAELRETLRLIDAAGYEGMYQFLNRIRPYPGTPLHRRYEAAGLLRPAWPVPEWELADPRIQGLIGAVSAVASREGGTFAEARATFARYLDALAS